MHRKENISTIAYRKSLIKKKKFNNNGDNFLILMDLPNVFP